MPNIKSAKKRVKVNLTKKLKNQKFKTSMKTIVKKYETTIASGDKALSADVYKDAIKKLDQAVAKGILHINTAARRKSQFTKKLNAL